MSSNHSTSHSDLNSRPTALETNVEAICVVAAAVKGTIGPKGLDTMLVGQSGDIVITNDGVTILNLMEVNHPAAQMLIKIAGVQQKEVGDGTTTATLMAGQMLSEGLKQVEEGVPVARVIEGLKMGITKAIEELETLSKEISEENHSVLTQIALVASREHVDIANLVVESAEIIGKEKLLEASFKLSDSIQAIEGAENEVFLGALINKERINKQAPQKIKNAKILIIDDALAPEEIEDAGLATEKGFARFMSLREEFKTSINKIVESGVNVVLVDRGVDDIAEEMLVDSDILVVERVPNKELQNISKHTKAKMIKRTGLNKPLEKIKEYIGFADYVYEDEKLKNIRFLNGKGEANATVIVSAATSEVVGERQRSAKDAASSVQASFKKGFVPGGGSIDLYLVRKLEDLQKDMKGMASFGVQCVISALEKPFMQIVINAGFNPLEKIGNVIQAQVEQENIALSIDCDTGEIQDMLVAGIVDPTLVKTHALKAAGEVAEAILRIDTIIRKKQD